MKTFARRPDRNGNNNNGPVARTMSGPDGRVVEIESHRLLRKRANSNNA
jgi:hypothetical protein